MCSQCVDENERLREEIEYLRERIVTLEKMLGIEHKPKEDNGKAGKMFRQTGVKW